MIYPAAFDSTKKYPVLVYVYGGPHAQMITNSWLGGADLWLYYMAQQGYIVFTMDNRGSMNRGLEFENATFRDLGKVEMEDQLAGVSYLKKLKYVDGARMGVYGWSFGGFMTTSLMTRTPDVFKLGVAGGPVIDWRMYEIMYTERYMDMPQNNAKGYHDADLTNYAKDLKGKLLLIHGTNDNVVLWQHTLTYLKKCVDEGVLIDYFVYPGHEHNVLGPDRVHLMRKISQYFKENL
jgi:dipeptidyl-peptidase-4